MPARTGRLIGPRMVLPLRRLVGAARRKPGIRWASDLRAIVASSRASGWPTQ
jgi:hypothetical protein